MFSECNDIIVHFGVLVRFPQYFCP